VLIESGLVRVPHHIPKLIALIAASVMALVLLAGYAYAQVEITPLPTESPSSELAPGTQWVFWMAIGAGVIAAIMLLAAAAGYLRFAPKFFGREEAPPPLAPGTRPPDLVRRAAQIRYTPPPAAEHAAAPVQAQAQARTTTATAVAERPAAAADTAAAPAAAATEVTTAPPAGEPAAQADAVGQAEVASPEERPSAKAPEEVGAPSAQAEAPPAAAGPSPAPPAAPTAPPAAPTAQPAAISPGRGEMDQETFDRVLKEQLDRGVDRRVAEGRARAAAVVAARKKTQG
jgi:hypothetical protein